MSRGYRRLLRAAISRFTAPVGLSKVALRRPLDFTRLEDRITPSLASPPDKLLPPGTTPLAVGLPLLDSDARPDFAALGTDGKLTIALNRGDDSWHKLTTADLGIAAPAGMA